MTNEMRDNIIIGGFLEKAEGAIYDPYEELGQLDNKYFGMIQQLKKYFTSGNNIPVERATILAKDFWAIVGKDTEGIK